MLSLALGAILATQTSDITIQRDAYGVPMINASSFTASMRGLGRAVAEDRLWQMEMSRRSARGRLSEVLGPNFLASDRDALRNAYTEEEMTAMFRQLPTEIRAAFEAYAEGVNETMAKRKAAGTLPEGYAKNGFEPQPWTIIDTCAISVELARQFGRGGAGELRNFALYQYLKTRPALKGKELDALDDLAWQNEPLSPTTVGKRDDLVFNPPRIWDFTRAESEKHVAALPPTTIFEIMPAIRAANLEDQEQVAESLGVPHKVGSYAIAVSPRRSASGTPLLLSAPQMGHTLPNVVYEAAIQSPEVKVAGMAVPGIPGILIGNSPDAAWGFTSGVADIEDVFVSALQPDGNILSNGSSVPLTKITFSIPVKGQDAVEFVQERTPHGPVLLKSPSSKAVYSLRSSFWMREIAGIASLYRLYSAQTPRDFTAVSQAFPMNFNLFFATKGGDIGYRFCGFMPLRAKGVDPRFPTPDTAENQWRGIVPSMQMPKTDNPESGIITNWNNKPVSWWPNGDTPVWGQIFRNAVLNDSIPAGKLSSMDLEKAAWTIARREADDNASFVDFLRQSTESTGEIGALARLVAGFDGWDVEGSASAAAYREAVRGLRRALFTEVYGNFTNEALFDQVLQPSVMLKAIEGDTKIDVRNGRSNAQIANEALASALPVLKSRMGNAPAQWKYRAGTMPVVQGDPIPYNNRGTYIHITEFNLWTSARSVASPGVAETGPFANNQADLARQWQFKTVWGWQ